jgi:glycosyltransferase involved in cell wall biosynthesis
MPVVSVVMPCYNSADTIEETLKSLTRQTLTDFELIAIDDGSSDLTRKILEAWARRDCRFEVIHQSHQGIIPALNAGLAVCQAPYIARMDADDRSLPQRLERQVDYLERQPRVSVAGCLVAGFPEDGVREGFCIYLEWLNSLVTDDEIRREIFVESPFAHPSVVFRREAVNEVGGYQEHGWPEDYDLWLRLYTAGARFAKVPEVLLEWREHPDRLTRTDKRYSLENFLRAKAYYLALGPLQRRDAVLVWGAGMMGRRLSKQLIRRGAPVAAFIDVDPKKIGKTRRSFPIIAPDDLPDWWKRYANPVVLAAVGARGARRLIRQQLNRLGLKEGYDWWAAA